MNLLVEVPPVGGLSSQIHMGLCIILQNISNIYDIKQFKFKLTSELFNDDLFDNIYQYDGDDYDYIKLSNENITANYSDYIDFYDVGKNYKESNYLMNLNKLKPNIISIIEDYVIRKNIHENTLGLHIRLTDMKEHDHLYGHRTYEDFIEKVRVVLQENTNINNIFVTSDNYESILKVLSDLPDIEINFIHEFLRCENENSDNWQLQIENLKNNNYCINTFIEMCLLSKCGYLVHRISGFSLCSILYSNTLKKTYLI